MSAAHECYLKWIEVGKQLGFEGTELKQFVKERTDEERQNRIVERDLKKLNAKMLKKSEARKRKGIRIAQIKVVARAAVS
jgi:hypothetical protein